MTSLAEVGLLRLAAQGLVGARTGPVEVVRWLAAVQAQDLPGALTSVALRAGSTTADVTAALDAGAVVRSWPMRGTLHLVAAEDLPWMLALMAPRVVRSTVGRRTGLGLDQAQLDRAVELAVAALGGGHRMRRAELFAHWDASGISTAGQRGVHLLGYLAMTGTAVLGPTAGREQLVVLTSEWGREPRVPERGEALGELALRYFTSHGPASVRDYTRWTNLLVSEVKDGVERARPHLCSLDVEGTEHLMHPATADRLAAHRAEAERVLLLPGFDELLLGYTDRRATLDPAHADRVVPGGNGMFLPTVLRAGQVIGTWRRRPRTREVVVTPFAPLAREVAAAVDERVAALPS